LHTLDYTTPTLPSSKAPSAGKLLKWVAASIGLAVTLSLIALITFVVIARFNSRLIPFDSSAWKSGDAFMRFRMKDDLVAKYQLGQLPTRAAVDDVLGPGDEDMGWPNRRFNLKNWDHNPWYLRIRFADDGRVSDFGAYPD
jgi:hypothetical protein